VAQLAGTIGIETVKELTPFEDLTREPHLFDCGHRTNKLIHVNRAVAVQVNGMHELLELQLRRLHAIDFHQQSLKLVNI
jgi:hypothetical protein